MSKLLNYVTSSIGTTAWKKNKRTIHKFHQQFGGGVRNLLQQKPSVKVDERLLSVQLSVQEVAAKAYLKQLIQVGIFDEEGRATDLANRWRMDNTYKSAVDDIVAATYPEGLIAVSSPDAFDRNKAVEWFMHDGLGKGAAGNKAATYALISTKNPSDGKQTTSKPEKGNTSSTPKSGTVKKTKKDKPVEAKAKEDREQNRGAMTSMPINVNLQIHIGADASSDQIENIFKAMRKYIYDK